MSGGFSPQLRTVSDGVTPEASVLASEHGMVKRAGITLDSSAWTADGDGNKVVRVGSIVMEDPETGKYIPFAAPGEGEDAPDNVGILVDASVNLRHGDVITGLLLHGSVLEARLVGDEDLIAAAKDAVRGRIIFQ